MSSKPAVATAVAKLFIAAGRRASDAEARVYHEALSDVGDDELMEAVATIVRLVDFVNRPPTPALIREYVMVVRARQPKPDALEETTGPPVDREEGLALIAEARAANRGVSS